MNNRRRYSKNSTPVLGIWTKDGAEGSSMRASGGLENGS